MHRLNGFLAVRGLLLGIFLCAALTGGLEYAKAQGATIVASNANGNGPGGQAQPTVSPTPTATATATAVSTPGATPTATAAATPTVTPPYFRVFWEGFDTFPPPALPPGWTTSFVAGPANCMNTGTCPLGTNWTTTNASSQTAPNSAFHDAPGCVTDSYLDTPSIFIPSTFYSSQLTFWHMYDLENGHDGGVLEISIDGGPFTDIIAAGGTIQYPTGYNGKISTDFLSPIAGRQAWTGTNNTFVAVYLPPSIEGHNVVFRFRLATDCAVAGVGWYIDSMQIAYPQGPTPTATATFTPTATATATTTPIPTPSVPPPTPTPTPSSHPLNLSTRLLVETGDNVGIGGFIISGTSPKQVELRAIGPSLANQGVPNPLADPILELHGPPGFTTIIADNFLDAGCGIGPVRHRSGSSGELPRVSSPSTDKGEPLCIVGGPTNDLEPCICALLDPGPYTAVIRGKNGGTGVGLVEVYDVGTPSESTLANISTRAFVSTGNDITIAGFILGGGNGDDNVIVRGIGPSLAQSGISNPLADPKLELRDQSGVVIRSNDNWHDDPVQAAIIIGAGFAPSDSLESALAQTLPPGAYTALLTGVNNEVGIGLVEVYDIGHTLAPTPTATATPAAE